MKNLIKIFKALRALKLAYKNDACINVYNFGIPSSLTIEIKYRAFIEKIPNWLLKHLSDNSKWIKTGYVKYNFTLGKYKVRMILSFTHIEKTELPNIEFEERPFTVSELESVKYENCTPFAKGKNDVDWNSELQEY